MAKSTKRLKFEEAVARLDEIVEAMETGEIGIEESLAQYEEAIKLAQHCREVLDRVEQRVRQIQVDAEGAVKSEPFESPEEGDVDDEDDET